jgi:hypothetical protein
MMAPHTLGRASRVREILDFLVDQQRRLDEPSVLDAVATEAAEANRRSILYWQAELERALTLEGRGSAGRDRLG